MATTKRGALIGISREEFVAVLLHPSLWFVALRQLFRLAPTGWWRRAPYLPLPDRRYYEFRMTTAYGGAGDRHGSGEDLITYLRWCKAWPHLNK